MDGTYYVENNGSTPPASTPETEGKLERFVAEQAALVGDRFAGASWESDGTVLFGIVEGAAMPPGAKGNPKIRVVSRRFSAKRLDQSMDIVASRLNPLLAPGRQPGSSGVWPWEADVKILENVVSVVIGREHEAKRAAVEAALADELSAGTVRISIGDIKPVNNTCSSRNNCAFPFRAGTQTTGQTNCTLGFVMKDWAGVRFQSTAGHCPGAQPAPYYHYHGGWQIGPDHWTEQPHHLNRGVDLKIIRQNNQGQNAPANFIYRDESTTTQVWYKNTDPSQVHRYRVCFVGTNSGQQCGTVQSTSTSSNGTPGFGRIAINQVCKGDSGGPVFHPADTKAYGLMSRAPIPQGVTCIVDPSGSQLVTADITWVATYEAASGHSVLLTPTTETLGPGQRMHAYDRITSTDGRYDLKMQPDGNLVLYQGATALWSTNTFNNPGAFVSMQNDGNLVVYRSNGTHLWSRGCCVAGTRLVVQNDANLVMYRPNGGVSWARSWG